LPGDAATDIMCDGCISHPPAWDNGRAAVVYNGGGRRVALALKHGDRLDISRPLSEWMVRAGADLLEAADAITPVPLHWRRLVKRRYNQSAEIARCISNISGVCVMPDLLIRKNPTPIQDGLTRVERYENQRGAFVVNTRYTTPKNVVIIDDVMTTGATISACAEVLRAAGAERIDALVLARVARDE